MKLINDSKFHWVTERNPFIKMIVCVSSPLSRFVHFSLSPAPSNLPFFLRFCSHRCVHCSLLSLYRSDQLASFSTTSHFRSSLEIIGRIIFNKKQTPTTSITKTFYSLTHSKLDIAQVTISPSKIDLRYAFRATIRKNAERTRPLSARIGAYCTLIHSHSLSIGRATESGPEYCETGNWMRCQTHRTHNVFHLCVWVCI